MMNESAGYLYYMPYKVLLGLFLLCSCATTRMTETDLYFGQSKPDGGSVTVSEWKDFRENKIAGVFKEGYTILDATGNWYDPVLHKSITEPTYIVVYYYKNSAQASRRIDSLRYWYKTRFHQQSVLRVDKKVKALF
jgi:hypothetical protein